MERCLKIIEGAYKEHVTEVRLYLNCLNVKAKEKKELGLVIDGHTLDFVLKDCPTQFYQVSSLIFD
jgi:hypothetical protein